MTSGNRTLVVCRGQGWSWNVRTHSSTGWTHLLAHCLAGLSGWGLRSSAVRTTWLRERRLGAKEGVEENTGNFPITTCFCYSPLWVTQRVQAAVHPPQTPMTLNPGCRMTLRGSDQSPRPWDCEPLPWKILPKQDSVSLPPSLCYFLYAQSPHEEITPQCSETERRGRGLGKCLMGANTSDACKSIHRELTLQARLERGLCLQTVIKLPSLAKWSHCFC